MIRDRWGNLVMVAYSETELLWIGAAISLPAAERTMALEDIASLTGRSLYHIKMKAQRMHLARSREEATHARQILERVCPTWRVSPPGAVPGTRMKRIASVREPV